MRLSTAASRTEWTLVWLMLAGFLPLGVSRAEQKPPAPEPKSRFFYNDDGDRGIFLLKGSFHQRQLHYPVDVLVGTGVTTLVYCANAGSDQAYYPSKVASALDWRMTKSHQPDNKIPLFPRVYRVGKQIREAGIDLLGTVMRRAKEQGLEFVPTLRMNDAHFAQKVPPTEHPLTGEFWMKHQDLTIGKAAPSVGGYYHHMLDFNHDEVRNYRMAQICELIDGYAADGFEMDFTRHYMFFPPGKEKPELLTEMVRKTRKRLDEKGRQEGRHLMLIVRVAHTLDRCKGLGCDVSAWIKEGLVDYVVPSSPDRYFTFDMPIDEFIEVAKGTSVRVVASPDSAPNDRTDGAIYRAGMANYYAMGQKDTYLFNFFTRRYPFDDEDYAILRDLKSPTTLWGRPKHFFARDFYRGRTVKLSEVGKRYDIRMYVGDDLALAKKENILKQAQLYLQVAGREAAELEIALNGQVLPLSAARTEGPAITFDLGEVFPKVGWNVVSVTAKKLADADSDARPSVARLELMTDYDILGVSWEK